MTIKTRNRLSLLFVALFALVVGAIAYPPLVSFAPSLERKLEKLQVNLGLDLQGGIYLEYDIDLNRIPPEDRAAALEAVQAVVERRVNAFGVGEPIVQRVTAGEKERLVVQLPGIRDIQAAKQVIKETPFLEFREEVEPDEETEKFLAKVNEEVKKRAEEVLRRALEGEDFAVLAAEYSDDFWSAQNGGDRGFVVEGDLAPHFNDALFADNFREGEVYPQLIETDLGWHIIKRGREEQTEKDFPIEGEFNDDGTPKTEKRQVRQRQLRQIFLAKKTVDDFVDLRWKSVGLTGQQLDRADFDPGGGTSGGVSEPSVLLFFNEEGKKIFADVTTRNVGKRFAIFLDGQIISDPVIQTPIVDGVASITGGFSIEEAKKLAQRLNEGALPVPIELVSQRSVDASLGAEALRAGLRAGALGLALTMLYITFYYRLFGFIASLMLIVYAATLVSLFKLSGLLPAGLNITLTLSGIAGFILSVGMAVDANILIFERIKEERRRGKTLKTAVAIGFERAWSSIRDGNVSTLITCVILIGVGTGFVQGFATILFLGVTMSMFTAVVLMRFVLRAVVGEKLEKKRWLVGM